jgi:outer membrane protein TolC
MSRPRLRFFAGLALAGLLLAGCNAPPVQRPDETVRFHEEMQRRVEELQLDLSAPLTLQRCEELALANSLDLRVRELGLRLEDDQVRLALAGGLPRGQLEYTQTRRSNEATVQFGDMTVELQDRNQQNLTVQAMVPILDFGLTYYAYRNALDRRSQQRLLLERTRQLLVRDVRSAYAQLAAAGRQARLADIAHQAAQHVLRVAQTMEREQLAVRADTVLIEAAVAQAGLELSLSRQRVEQASLALAQLMSLPPSVRVTIISELPELPLPPSAEQVADYEDRALQHRPELLVQDLQRHISANTIRREASGFFPRLDGLGSFNWSGESTLANASYFLLGFRIAHSLLDGGSQIFRHSLARHTAEQEAERTLLISMGILYDVQLSALRLRQAHETVQAAQVLERARREALNRIISLYQEGLEDEAATARSLADLTIQATVLDRAQTEVLLAWYQLQAAALVDEPPATQAGMEMRLPGRLELPGPVAPDTQKASEP